MRKQRRTSTTATDARERRRTDTCRAILDAAQQTVSDQGVQGVGICDIAARAGVAVGTLYNHFGDREALLTALLTEQTTALSARIDETLATSRKGPFAAQVSAVA